MLAFTLGEFIAITTGNIVYIIMLFPILFVVKKITKKQTVCFFVIFLFACVGFSLTMHSLMQKEQICMITQGNNGSGSDCTVIGTVYKIEDTAYGKSVYLKEVVIKQNFSDSERGYQIDRLLVYINRENNVQLGQDVRDNGGVESDEIKLGQRIKVCGRIELFEQARNYGNFDAKEYYESLGIFGKITAEKFEIIDYHFDNLKCNLDMFLSEVNSRLKKICDRNNWNIYKGKAEIFSAMILGTKSEIDEGVKELYSISGIAHILAISGLHISMIGMFLFQILRKRFGFVLSATVSVVVVILFGIMSGLSVATLRAVIMFVLKLVGEVLGRSYDYMTSISLAGILLLIDNPFLILHSGFQMSFAAIFSIVIVWENVQFILQLEKHSEKLEKHSEKLEKHSEKLEKGARKFWKSSGNFGKHSRVFLKRLRDMGKHSRVLLKSSGIGKHLGKLLWIKMRNAVLLSITIHMFLAPIIAYNYYQIPTYSFLLNIIIVPLMSVVIGSAIIAVLVSFCSMTVGSFFIAPGCIILTFYEKLCAAVLKLPYANIIVGKPSKWVIAFYYTLIFVVLMILKTVRKKQIKIEKDLKRHIAKQGKVLKFKREVRFKEVKKQLIYIFSMLLLFFVLSFLMYGVPKVYGVLGEKDLIQCTFLDVGQGDGIFLKLPDGVTFLIDGGSSSVSDVGKFRMEPYLKAKGVTKIDYVVLTHSDKDHMNGLLYLLEQSSKCGVQIKNIVLADRILTDENDSNIEQAAMKNHIAIQHIKKGDLFRIGNVKIKCIHPDFNEKLSEKNNSSVVLEVTYGKFSMLLTGDISQEVEDVLELGKNQYTVLKVAHHGSKYSTSEKFLKRVCPLYSIISVGKNMYGHPSSEVLERLGKCGTKVLRTDICGQLTIYGDGKKLYLEQYL